MGADPNLRTPDGWSALMAAGQFGTAAMVKVLVLAKADLNLQMKNGWCAVIAAAQFGTTAMVQELVEAKANVNLQTENGWSALMAAALGRNAEMVQDLIDGKADVNQQTHTGSSALIMTAVSGDVASARELLDAHADPDLTEFSGFSPLMVAADNNHLKVAHVLVDRRARTELVARTGQSAMQVAMAKGYEDLVRYLRGVTPVGWGLTRTILQTSEFWYHVIGGLGAGAVAGIAIYTFTHQEDVSVKSQSAWSGSCRLALKTVSGSQVLGQAFRCLEVIACIIMPLGVAMMWIDAFKFIPLFFLFYVLPPLVAGTPIWQPALLLIGAPRGRGIFDRRLPRILATAVLLTLTAYQTYPGSYHCEDQIKFYSKGNMTLDDEMASFPATIMVHFPWLLNRASSMLVCPSFNHMPSAQMNVNLPIPLPGLRELFFTYQMLSTYGLATYVHWVVDIGLDEKHGSHYRNLPRLQPRALLLEK
ncbi:Ank2 [Symbiodinium sp. CCMP2456]|nr:Ank2 [Symbiodinium sp. CCMP2456]